METLDLFKMVQSKMIFNGWEELSHKYPQKTFTKLRKVHNTDRYHAHTYLHGTIFKFWVIYTNNQILFLAMAHYYEN